MVASWTIFEPQIFKNRTGRGPLVSNLKKKERGFESIELAEIVLIHDLNRRGLAVSAIARQIGLDRKTFRKHRARGLEAPECKPRIPRPLIIEPYESYMQERLSSFPDLTARRLMREIRERGYDGGYTAVKTFVREVGPPKQTQFERRFETPPCKQTQVDFAEFAVEFTDELGVTRKVWLFSMVLGHLRWLWGRFCANQNLQTVMRRHVAAFDATAGAL